MRLISTLLTLVALGYGVMWLGKHHPGVGEKAVSFLQTKPKIALQPQFTPDQVIEDHSRLLSSNRSTIQGTPHITYIPLLLMQVKYADTSYTTGEGPLLWDLSDGEMILNIHTWQKSHGLADCVRANITKQECKVVSLMAKKGGQLGRESIRKGLRVDGDLVDQWLDDCRRKKLLVPSGNGYRLHMQDPKFPSSPVSIVDTQLTTYSTKKAEMALKRFGIDEITSFASAYFGSDFAIKSAEEVLLPIYTITTESYDGRMKTYLFNGLTGKELPAGAAIY